MGTAVESACVSGGPSEMAGLAERINAEHRPHLASAFDSPVEYVRALQGIVGQRELVA